MRFELTASCTPCMRATNCAIARLTNLIVGVTGLEPAAYWSQTNRSSQLSYTPILLDTQVIQPFILLTNNTSFILIRKVPYGNLLLTTFFDILF